MNYDEETQTFGLFFFGEGEVQSHTVASVAPIFKQLNGVRGSLWPKHGALLSSPHADVEQGQAGVIFDILLMLKSCPIYFCYNRRKLLKPHCSLAAKRGNLVNTGFLFSGTLSSAQNFLVLCGT